MNGYSSSLNQQLTPVQDWCRANNAECLAVQPPGRNLRSKHTFADSAASLAKELLPVVASRLASTPYVIVGHSLGTWLAFELLSAARDAGLPLPLHASLSALCAPDIPFDQRPWRQQRTLGEEDFKARGGGLRAWHGDPGCLTRSLQMPTAKHGPCLLCTVLCAGGVPRLECERDPVHARALADIPAHHASRLPTV